MNDKYILDGHKAIPADLMTWAKWFQTAERHVADEMVGSVRISTIFLGLDHSFGGSRPLLFETMIFGGSLDQEMRRYSTWKEAEAGHKKMVEQVKATSLRKEKL